MRVAIVAGFSMLLAGPAAAVTPDQGREVKDGAGRSVLLPLRPERIISMAPSVTEILFAIGAGDRVVGVTDFCDYPAGVASRPRIGGLINPDLERIVSLGPDLVLATTSGNYLDDVERIQRVGIPVYAIETRTIQGTLRTFEELGALIGSEDAARKLVAGLRARIERARAESARRPRRRTLFVIEPEPLIAPGRDTFIGEALEIAGADPVTAGTSSGWAQYDMEQVIGMRPEVILTPEANRAWAAGIARSAEWVRVPAVSAGRVFVISDSIQHPGPRLVDGIEEVAGILAGVPADGSSGK